MGSVRNRTMPIPLNMLCTLTFISKNLAHGTGLPSPQGVCTTVDVSGSLAHMAGRNIHQSFHFYTTTQKGTRGLGVIRRSCKMPCPPSQPNVGPRRKRLVSDGGVVSVLGSARAPREPLSGEDTEDDGVPALCMHSG